MKNISKNKIKLIDVTLRDGGFTCDFDWPMEFAKEYYSLMSSLKLDYIELGYWGQTSKSKNQFYNLNQQFVEEITSSKELNNISVMIDYHYCNKDFNTYPTSDQSEIKMIRMTARKDMIDDAIKFAEELKKETNLEISFNIFNITSYEEKELSRVVDKTIGSDFEYIYMADTHGHLDLAADIEKYEKEFKRIKESGKKTGFHLHNHTGKAYINYVQCLNSEHIDACDTSVMSLGKGAGNLRLENVLGKDDSLKLNNFILKHYERLFKKTVDPYYLTTGIYGITDNYATQANKLSVSMENFSEFCSIVTGLEKDNFDKHKLLSFLEEKI